MFENGQKNLVELCWNGEYFQQNLPGYLKMPGEVGPGCMSDQLIGQWWAHQLGLGYLLPREKVQVGPPGGLPPQLEARPHRLEARAPGVRRATGTRGSSSAPGRRAAGRGHVMLYSDEVWTGIEYQVAAHLIYEGMIEEGLAIVKGARDRYDGIPRPPIPRNPWNEIECGGHYARAMSCWSLLLALSGFHLDGPAGELRFTPRWKPDRFSSVFTGPRGWGRIAQARQGAMQREVIDVDEGVLSLASLRLEGDRPYRKAAVTAAGRTIDAAVEPSGGEVLVRLASRLELKGGERLEVVLS